MKLLDRLRGGSAKKESKSDELLLLQHQPTTTFEDIPSSPDTSPATTEDLSPRNHHENGGETDESYPKSPKEGTSGKHHNQQQFSWGLRRKRKDESPVQQDLVGCNSRNLNQPTLSVPNTPQNRDIYIEDDHGSQKSLLQTPLDDSAALPQQRSSHLKAKNLFVSTIAPVVELPSTKAASVFARLAHPASQKSTDATEDETYDEAAWDYDLDIPLFVDEEDFPVIHRILMMQTPKRLVLPKPSPSNSHEQDSERNIVARAVAALDKAGNDLFAQGRYEDAYLRYERALLLKKRTLEVDEQENGEHDEQLVHAANGTGKLNSASLNTINELEQAQMNAKAANSKEQKATILASVATSINNITYIKQRTGQATTEETMASYLKSLQIKRDILGPDHLSVGKTLNNIGSVFYLKREYEPALTAYKDAYRIMEQALGVDHLDVGTVVSNVGDVYFALGDKAQALEHYNRALDVRWSKLKSQDQKVVRLMQQVALLETGVQPSMDALAKEGVSDPAETEVIREMERHQMSVFIEDIQKLQEEVKDDMRYFDLAERQLEIDMVKDRMRIFREMREIYNASEDDFNIEDSLRESMKIIPGLAAQLKRVQNHEYDDVYREPLDNPDAIDEAPVVQSDGKVQIDSAINGMYSGGDKESETTKTDDAIQPGSAYSEIVLATPQKGAPLMEVACGIAETDRQVENEHPQTIPIPVSMSGTLPTPESSFGMGSVLQNANDGVKGDVATTRSSEDSLVKANTLEDRKAALNDVRNRLDRLRRERDQRVTWEVKERLEASEPPQETKRRSYMFPTIASAAKAMTPKKLRRVHSGFYWNRKSTPKNQPSIPTTAEE
ncbi:hypothetical protein MPSEU_000538200 [Mayamaea pseudoterrestris]|nr:hypothetical protein MPSEU_000537800 [Mayamaea pseudoterrestris]GKY95775.1 hypothetical protein MPSEU_000538200 [Mayamaea pseudoterrestris]